MAVLLVWVCVSSQGRAGCQKVTYFLFNNLHETFCVRPCAQYPSSTLPLPFHTPHSVPHADLLLLSWLPCWPCVCGVYTAFAFDKVNQKFFNPFCIQANIDRHTHTHTYTVGATYGQKGIISLPACLSLCVCSLSCPTLSLEPLWVPAAPSKFLLQSEFH